MPDIRQRQLYLFGKLHPRDIGHFNIQQNQVKEKMIRSNNHKADCHWQYTLFISPLQLHCFMQLSAISLWLAQQHYHHRKLQYATLYHLANLLILRGWQYIQFGILLHCIFHIILYISNGFNFFIKLCLVLVTFLSEHVTLRF